MIIVLDTETRGLYGDIFLLACYDGSIYRQFYHGRDFLSWVMSLEVEEKEEISVYCFNLDFDLSKLVKESCDYFTLTGKPIFEIDYKKSLIINNRFHTAKISGSPVIFRDLYPLVNTSLDKACKDFQLTTRKMELPIKDKDKYFREVSPHCPDLQQYLKQDVLSTWELLYTLQGLSGLEMEKFIKCPTLASLAMAIYRQTSPAEFKEIKESYLDKEQEEFIRNAYHGGRTEIFKHRLEDGGYHYDINSLYPHVMETNQYPTGRAMMLRRDMSIEQKTTMFWKTRECMDLFSHYFVHAKVHVPKQHVGPLPYRDKRGLIFPIGTFTGYFCSPELEYAITSCDVEVLEVYDIIAFGKQAYLFDKFIQTQKQIKLTSEGAKRTFSKLIQNSLYGKFGMGRHRETHELHTPAREAALRKKGTTIAITNTYNNNHLITYIKLAFADYIRPQYAALITSYARVELLKKLRGIPPEHLYYCDTDSIVSGIPFEEEEVNPKIYGKWKLERNICEGIYVLPKLYAERDASTGEEVLKSKGIVKDYQQNVTYRNYLDYYQSMVAGVNHILYGEFHHMKYYQRRKLMSAIKSASNIEEKILLQKQFLFAFIRQKRIYNFQTNSSIPIDITENSEYNSG